MVDRIGDAVTDYVLTASRFDQIVERNENGSARRIVKHRRGDVVDGLTEAEVERLLRAGAITPVVADDEDPESDSQDESAPPTTGEAASTPAATTVKATGAPERPKQTAPVAEWEEYAAALHSSTGGTQGLDLAAAKALTKRELIEQLP